MISQSNSLPVDSQEDLPELSKCPLCDSQATLLIKGISCDVCLCDLGRARDQTDRQLIEAWNHRPADAKSENASPLNYLDESSLTPGLVRAFEVVQELLDEIGLDDNQRSAVVKVREAVAREMRSAINKTT